MKINRPGAPIGGGDGPLEPLDPRDLQSVVKGERFAAVLADLEGQKGAAQSTGAGASGAAGSAGKPSSATRTALEQIARSVNLANPDEASAAVRESAGLMVRAGLGDNYRDPAQSSRLVDELSDFILADPLLKTRLLSILTKLQAA